MSGAPMDTLQPLSSGGPLVLAMLAPPSSTGETLSRPRLVGRLNAAIEGPLTLVSGEPASGKTTLALDWLASTGPDGPPTAWLTVTTSMNHPVQFWRYLLAALEPLGVTSDDLSRSLADNEPPGEDWLTGLANRLAVVDGDPVIIVDDLHELTIAEADDAFASFLRRLPASVHVVLLTRVKPTWAVTGLRATGRLTEIESLDLRMTTDELALLIATTDWIDLSPSDVDLLHSRTEGWAGGIKLALLSMRHTADPSAFVDHFAADDELVSTYLFRDVLERQLPEIRDFLLDVSVLDHLTPATCDFIRERNDSRELLESCRAANLFLLEFDAPSGSFRLHSLFAQLLRSRLGIEDAVRLAELHRRASELFEERRDISGAIEHAIAAGEHARTGELMARYASGIAGVGGRFDEVNRWMSLLHRDLVAESPETALGLASTLCVSGRPEEALTVLEPVLERTRSARIKYAAHQLRGFCAFFDARFDMMASVAVDLDADVGDGEIVLPFDPRRFRNIIAGVAEYFVGDLPAARLALEDATAAPDRPGLFYVSSPGWLALVASAEGSLTEACLHAEESLRRHVQMAGEAGAIIVPAHLVLADAAWERNDLVSADRHLAVARKSVHPIYWETVLVQISASRLLASRGNVDEARAQLLEAGQTYLSGDSEGPLRAMMCRQALDLALHVGDVEDAIRWADGVETYGRRPVDAALRLRLAVARGDEDLAEPVEAALAASDGPVGPRLDALLAVAEHVSVSGDQDRARDLVGRATFLAEPELFVRRFVDSGEHVRAVIHELATSRRVSDRSAGSPFFLGVLASSLDTDGGVGPRHPPNQDELVTPLSDREIEVLHQLAAGLSYTEIGQTLYVTRNTIKSHVQHVYTKLGVASRSEALEEAHRLGIV